MRWLCFSLTQNILTHSVRTLQNTDFNVSFKMIKKTGALSFKYPTHFYSKVSMTTESNLKIQLIETTGIQ